jgi:hypothetical protein
VVRCTFSPARAWQAAVGYRLPQTLGVTNTIMRSLQFFPIFTLVITVISGCSTTPAVSLEPTKLLIGCWEGKDYQPVLGQSAKWLMQRRSDGTFDIEFRAEGQPPQRETGKWSVEGKTYTTITLTIDNEPVNVRDPQFTDVYELKNLSAQSMTYFHPKMNVTFQSIKVACPSDA